MPDPVDAHGPRRRSILPILSGLIVAILLGMGAMAWLFHRFDSVSEIVKPPAPLVVPPPPESPPALITLAPPPPETVERIVDQRIEKIEEQVEDIGARAAEATNEAQRAERLLIAFAARRAIDHGAPLGYLEAVIRQRFGKIEPRAVALVISASRQPVTIAQLREELDALQPRLAAASEEAEGWWESIRRELAGLIVVRRADTPSSAPVDRFTRAQDALATGQVDAALLEVARLPGRKAAAGWMAQARRYVQVRAALDRIESAALLEPVDPPKN